MAQEGNRTSERIIPCLLTACFLLLAPRFVGLSFGDDSFYLWSGHDIKLSALLGPQDWSPLYCLWFRLISFFVANPIAQYFTSWAVLLALAALLPTFMKIRSAWLYGAVLVSIPVLTAGPYVGLFASVLLLFGTCLILRRDWSLPGVIAMACAFSFVISFCRPEFNVSVYLCAAATLVALAVERSGHRLFNTPNGPPRTLLSTSLIAGTVLALAVIILLIFTHSPSKRSGVAFAQHYNRRAADRGLIPKSIDVWASNYAEQAFGVDTAHNAANGTALIGDFLRANPRLFLRHLLSNLLDPKTLVFLLLVGSMVAWPWLRQNRAHLRPASLWIALLTLPPLAGMIVIYPRDHYAIILLPSLLLFAMQVIEPQRWIRPSIPWAVGLGCALIWFLNLGLPRLRHDQVTFDRMSLLRAECIRQADRTADPANPNVFDISIMTDVYLVHPRTVTRPADLPHWPQFAAWATSKRPAWIAVDPWVSAPYDKTPAEISTFLSSTLGYTAHPCAATAYLTLYTQAPR